MARLPRLQSGLPITDKDGRPASWFHLWFQKFAEAIEGAIDEIVTILVRLGLVEITADGALELASSAINPGGTIKDGKVLTGSIINNGVTERYLAQILADITLDDGVETDIASVSIIKDADESDIDLDASLRLKSSDDVRGTVRIYRDATVIDSFDPFMNGAGGTFRTILTMPYTDSGVPAGSYVYKMTFERSGGASALSAGSGSLLRSKEIKR